MTNVEQAHITIQNWLRVTVQFLQRSPSEIEQSLTTFLSSVDLREIIDNERGDRKFPSARSRLNGIRPSIAANSRFFHERSRDIWLVITLLRLYGFVNPSSHERSTVPVPTNDDSTKKRSFSNFETFVAVSRSSSDVSDSTVATIRHLLYELRREARVRARRGEELEKNSNDLEREIATLRTEYDALLVQARERYGEWLSRDNEDSGASKERLRLSRQIDELAASAEKMVALLTSSDDSVRLAVQYKTVEMERALMTEEDRSRQKYEEERNALLARIDEMRNVRLRKMAELRNIVMQIDQIVTRVRDVIAKITGRLVDLLNRRKREREKMQRDVSTVTDARTSLDRDTIRRVRDVTLERRLQGMYSMRQVRYLEEYTSKLSYPTIVDSADLRAIHEDVCEKKCRYMLLLATRIRHNDDNSSHHHQSTVHTVERITRNGFVACLFFYGTTHSFLDIVENWYKQMNEHSAKANGELYEDMHRVVRPPLSKTARTSYLIFVTLRLDLRLIPSSIFYNILHLFRLRCRRNMG